MKTRYVSKDEHRSFGGWGSYMDFIEILNDDDEVVAMVSEELGTIWTPRCLETLSYENQAQYCVLREFNEAYVVVEYRPQDNGLDPNYGKLYAFPIIDLSEQLRERCKAFSMKVICERANVSYDGFRQWKRGKMKLSEGAIARLICQMDEA